MLVNHTTILIMGGYVVEVFMKTLPIYLLTYFSLRVMFQLFYLGGFRKVPDRAVHCSILTASFQEEPEPFPAGNHAHGTFPVHVDQQPHGSCAVRVGKYSTSKIYYLYDDLCCILIACSHFF